MTIRNFLALATLCLIWGSTWLVIKQGLQDLPPLTSAGIRFLVAAPLMAGVAAVLGRREGGGPPSGRLTLVLGLGNFGISFGIVYYCETVLPS
ncbi:MAG: EamA family transporter, partial [Planctomycetes bacterium]|nr:EamA family transporter [Planctomycetota bacterium]